MNPKGENVKLFLVLFHISRKDKIIYETIIFQAPEGEQDKVARKILKSSEFLNGAKMLIVIRLEAAIAIVNALGYFLPQTKIGFYNYN
jgi:hypothetical protein